MPLLIGKNTVYFHTPKCGGSWIRKTVENAGLPICEIIPAVRNDRKINGHSNIRINDIVHMPSLLFPIEDKFCFTTVRNPLTWLISTFRHYQRVGWPDSEIENKTKSKYFNEFAGKYEKYFPGIMGKNFDTYTYHCQFVGKQENLADDLVKALRLGGEEFDEEKLRATAPVNKNTVAKDETYHPEVKRLVIEKEKSFIEQYYPDIL